MIYRETPEGMPEPPRRGNWASSCPHGLLSRWQWVCDECKPPMEPVPSVRTAVAIWLILAGPPLYFLVKWALGT